MEYKIGDVILILNNLNNPGGPIRDQDVGKVARICELFKDRRYTVKVDVENLKHGWVFGDHNIMFLGRKDAAGRFRLHGKWHSGDLKDIQNTINTALQTEEGRKKYPINGANGKAKAVKVEKKEAPKIDFEAARKEAIAALNGERDGLCYYSMVLKDGSVKRHSPDICHARLSASVMAFDSVAQQVKSKLDKDQQETFIEMVDWLVNRSHFSAAFITKDAKKITEEYAEYDTEQPLWYVFSSAVALRGFHEFPQQTKSWKVFKEAGVEEKYLWVACLLFREDGVWTGTDDAHRCWTSAMSLDFFKKWFKEGFDRKLFNSKMKDDGSRFSSRAFSGKEERGNDYADNEKSVNAAFMKRLKAEKAGPFGGAKLQVDPKKLNNLMKEILE